jgi:hypothetical protein
MRLVAGLPRGLTSVVWWMSSEVFRKTPFGLLVSTIHRRFRVGFGIPAMAACSLAFGAGGFSSRFSTVRLSRSAKMTRSDCSITASDSRKAGCRTKSLKSMCLKATAHMSAAFCSGRSPRATSASLNECTALLGAHPELYCTLSQYHGSMQDWRVFCLSTQNNSADSCDNCPDVQRYAGSIIAIGESAPGRLS